MSQNRFKRVVLYPTAGIGFLIMLLALLFAVERKRTQSENGAVLSAFFSQEALHEIDSWRAERTVEIVIQRDPDCRLCSGDEFDKQFWFAPSLRSRWNTLSNSWFAQSSRITRTSFFLNSVFSADISTDLRLPTGARAVFVNADDLRVRTSDFEARFPNNLGYFVVSRIGLNLNKTEALLYIDHFCGGLCGGGEYVLMRKVNGVWLVADQLGTWVS